MHCKTDLVKKDEMGRECGTHGRDDNIFCTEPVEENSLGRRKANVQMNTKEKACKDVD